MPFVLLTVMFLRSTKVVLVTVIPPPDHERLLLSITDE